jgi:hypothetical protein
LGNLWRAIFGYPGFEMQWASDRPQRLKRVFNIDVEKCLTCGGAAKVIPKALAALAGQALACIEDPDVPGRKNADASFSCLNVILMTRR